MKPFKSLLPLSKWLLRIALAAIVYLKYLDKTLSFSFHGISYFIALSIVILTVLIIIGGTVKSSTLTIISGLLIVIALVIQLFFISGFSLYALISIFPLAALSFYFFISGNA